VVNVPASCQYARDLVNFAANTLETDPNSGLGNALYFFE